jgi:hypothetical protein
LRGHSECGWIEVQPAGTVRLRPAGREGIAHQVGPLEVAACANVRIVKLDAQIDRPASLHCPDTGCLPSAQYVFRHPVERAGRDLPAVARVENVSLIETRRPHGGANVPVILRRRAAKLRVEVCPWVDQLSRIPELRPPVPGVWR